MTVADVYAAGPASPRAAAGTPPDRHRLLVLSDAPTDSLAFARRIQQSGHIVRLAPAALAELAVPRSGIDVVLLDLRVTDTPEAAAGYVRAAAALGVPVVVVATPHLDLAGVLDAGADDALTRPVVLPELLARIRAHHRRAAYLRCADVVLDAATRRAWVGTEPLVLAYNEFTLLHALATRRGGLVTHDDAARAIWGAGPRPGRTACYAVAFRLRHKLGAAGARVTLRSVRRIGFRLDRDTATSMSRAASSTARPRTRAPGS